jgi:hypothetical protein
MVAASNFKPIEACLLKETFEFGGEIVWRPTSEHVKNANLTRFMEQHGIVSFDELLKRSTEDDSPNHIQT